MSQRTKLHRDRNPCFSLCKSASLKARFVTNTVIFSKTSITDRK